MLPWAQFEPASPPALISLEHRSPDIIILPELPDRWSARPLPPAGEGPIWNDWPDLPPIVGDKPSLPEEPSQSPDPYDPGGYSDIGDFDSTGTPEAKPVVDPSGEAQDVLALLDSLQYVPTPDRLMPPDLSEPVAPMCVPQVGRCRQTINSSRPDPKAAWSPSPASLWSLSRPT